MAGPRMPKRGNPAATYTNEKPLDKYQDAEETPAPGPIAPLSVHAVELAAAPPDGLLMSCVDVHRDCMDGL